MAVCVIGKPMVLDDDTLYGEREGGGNFNIYC